MYIYVYFWVINRSKRDCLIEAGMSYIVVLQKVQFSIGDNLIKLGFRARRKIYKQFSGLEVFFGSLVVSIYFQYFSCQVFLVIFVVCDFLGREESIVFGWFQDFLRFLCCLCFEFYGVFFRVFWVLMRFRGNCYIQRKVWIYLFNNFLQYFS